MGDSVALHLEIRQQGGLFLRHTDEVCQRIDVLDENRTEVADERISEIIVRRMASAEDKSLTVEHS